jgi:8-oxo-dGTP diphosphatase
MERSIRVVVAEIEQDTSYLLTQRLSTSSLPLLWEFPGGRVHEGESDEEALSRTLLHRIDAMVDVGACVMEHKHSYDGYDVVLAVYRTVLCSGMQALKVESIRWVPFSELHTYDFPTADQETMDILLSEGIE